MPYTKRSMCIAVAMACAVTACENAPTAMANGSSRRVESHHTALLAAPAARGLSIVACPPGQPQEVSGTIGPDGGILTLGPFTLRVPDGVLSGPTVVTMTRPAGARLIVRIELSGADRSELDRDVELTIRYGSCSRQDLARRAVRIVRLEGSGFVSGEDMIDQDDSSESVTLYIRRFSTFAVAY